MVPNDPKDKYKLPVFNFKGQQKGFRFKSWIKKVLNLLYKVSLKELLYYVYDTIQCMYYLDPCRYHTVANV